MRARRVWERSRRTVAGAGSTAVLRVRAWAMSSPRRRELTLELGDRVPVLKRIATRARFAVTRQDLGEQLWGRGGDADQLPSDALPWHAVLELTAARRSGARPSPGTPGTDAP